MNFIEELTWRGMLHDTTPGVEAHLNQQKVLGYIGFDPTAPSMTIGNYVQIMLLSLFQKAGHQPIVLMGGATGRIGDPSGKDKERQLKSYDELDQNLNHQVEQMKKFLDFENGDNKAILVNNLDFYKEMNVLDFLRKAGKNLTVNYMLSKDSVKNRLDTGLSFAEFSYQLLQAYDFLCLYNDFDCTLQMGGSDQWGNITSGTEFIRRCTEDGKAYAVTTPLLTKSDGKKFGKSEEGNIWLDPKLTSPYRFYQFWLNSDDADLPKFLRYFSLKSKSEVEALEAAYQDDPRGLKKVLAEEITARVHSPEALEKVQIVTEILFNKNASAELLNDLTSEEWQTISAEIRSFEVSKKALTEGIGIVELLAEETSITSSKGDARRAIKNNAISVNKAKIQSPEYILSTEQLHLEQYVLLENGRKNKFVIKFL